MIAFDKLTKEQLYEFIDVFDELILKEYGWCRAYDKEAFLEDFLETIQKVGNVYCFYVDVKRKGGKKRNSRFFYFDALFFESKCKFNKMKLKRVDETTFMLADVGYELLNNI